MSIHAALTITRDLIISQFVNLVWPLRLINHAYVHIRMQISPQMLFVYLFNKKKITVRKKIFCEPSNSSFYINSTKPGLWQLSGVDSIKKKGAEQ